MLIRNGYVCAEVQPEGGAGPVAPLVSPTAPTQPPQIQPAAPEKQASPATTLQPPAGDPSWLPQRLEQAKRVALIEAGFKDPEEAKAAKAAYEATKSAEQKTQERLAHLEPEAAAAKELRAKLIAYAELELAKLTEAQQSAVTRIVGEDRTRVLDMIAALRPTWDAQSFQREELGDGQPKLPIPGQNGTSPGRNAPAPAMARSETSKLARYIQLDKENPFKAAVYLAENYADIAAEQRLNT